MLRLIGIVISIGLADSLDPTTVGPGLLLALGDRPARRVLHFAAGVFVVMVLAGGAVVIGPGQLLLSLVPRPSPSLEHWLEVGVGAALVLGGAALWPFRHRLARREIFTTTAPQRRSSLWLGIGVMTVNLPVAVPYFAALAAIIASGRGLLTQLTLVVLYSLCFVAPLLVMVAVLELARTRAEQILSRARAAIQRHWATALSVLLALAGVVVIGLGLIGFYRHAHRHHVRLLAGPAPAAGMAGRRSTLSPPVGPDP